jgi:hypothetical protein
MEGDEYVDHVDSKQVWHITIPAIALVDARPFSTGRVRDYGRADTGGEP